MSFPFSALVQLVDHDWFVVQGDPATYGLVDGLTITRAAADDLWPPAPAPAELRFQVISATFTSEFPTGVPAIGDTVRAKISDSRTPGVVLEEFKGRIADVTASPHRLGVLFTFICLEFSDDFRQYTTGTVALPPLNLIERIYSAVENTPAVGKVFLFPPTPEWVFTELQNGALSNSQLFGTVGREASPTDTWSMITDLLRQAPVPTPNGGWARLYLFPTFPADNIHLEGGATWFFGAISDNPDMVPPLVLQLFAGKWTALGSDTGGAVVIPASSVDFNSTYSLTKADPTRVTVTSSIEGIAAQAADLGVQPRVGTEVPSDLGQTTVMRNLATMYLPSDIPTTSWAPEAFTYYASRDGQGTGVPRDLGAVVLVDGVPVAQSPTGKPWIIGQLAGRVTTVANGDVAVEFQLRRPDFRPAAQAVKWSSPALNGVTWANLSPTDTWADYRAVRTTK